MKSFQTSWAEFIEAWRDVLPMTTPRRLYESPSGRMDHWDSTALQTARFKKSAKRWVYR